MGLPSKILAGFLCVILFVYLLLIVSAFWPSKTLPVAQVAGKEARFITVDGRAIHYETAGQGRPLVLVHGFAGSAYTWRRLVPLLADRFTVYALDLPGFGLSDKPTDYNYDMQTQGRMVLRVMDALGLQTAALAGHSMGGIIAACASAAAPKRVDALVLVEPGFYSRQMPAFFSHLFFPLDRLMARLFYTRGFCRSFLNGSYYDMSLVTDEVVDAYMVPTLTPGALEALVHMYQYAGPVQYSSITRRIVCPTLLVWGENSRKANMAEKLRTADRIRQEIKGSQLVRVPHCGHYVQEEKSGELAQAMRDFLAK